VKKTAAEESAKPSTSASTAQRATTDGRPKNEKLQLKRNILSRSRKRKMGMAENASAKSNNFFNGVSEHVYQTTQSQTRIWKLRSGPFRQIAMS